MLDRDAYVVAEEEPVSISDRCSEYLIHGLRRAREMTKDKKLKSCINRVSVLKEEKVKVDHTSYKRSHW